MILTNNYDFRKPELTDAADITSYNQNWDTLDNELYNLHNYHGVKAISSSGQFSTWINVGTVPYGKTLNDVFMVAITFNCATIDAYDPITLQGIDQFIHEETKSSTIHVSTVSGSRIFSGLVDFTVVEATDDFGGYLSCKVNASRFDVNNGHTTNCSGTIDKITVYFK